MIELTIPGNPIAKKRPRFVRRGKFTAAYNPQETEEGKFALMAKSEFGNSPLTAPLHVDFEFHLPRPNCHYGTGKNTGVVKDKAPRHHTGKPDIDNLVKFTMDALNGIVWVDDSIIVASVAEKVWAGPMEAKTVIRIEEVE